MAGIGRHSPKWRTQEEASCRYSSTMPDIGAMASERRCALLTELPDMRRHIALVDPIRNDTVRINARARKGATRLREAMSHVSSTWTLVLRGSGSHVAGHRPRGGAEAGRDVALLHLGQPAERVDPRGGDDLDRLPVHA